MSGNTTAILELAQAGIAIFGRMIDLLNENGVETALPEKPVSKRRYKQQTPSKKMRSSPTKKLSSDVITDVKRRCKRIADWRERLNLTQRDVITALGLKNYPRIERGVCGPVAIDRHEEKLLKYLQGIEDQRGNSGGRRGRQLAPLS